MKRSRVKDDWGSSHINHHGDDERKRHGHSHEVPDSVASIAWMVIMGDGLHNFTDGLAIGMCLTISGRINGIKASRVKTFPEEIGQYLTRLGCCVTCVLVLTRFVLMTGSLGMDKTVFLYNHSTLYDIDR